MTGLRYVALADCARIAGLDADPVERAAAFADVCRLNALYMIERAGSGHPGTTLSSIDVVAWLHLEVLGDGDRYFSSKGHDVPGLYAVLAALGRLDFDLIHQLRRLDGLPGHPDVAATPEVVTSTGRSAWASRRHAVSCSPIACSGARVGSTCSPATASSRRASSGSRSSRPRTASSARSP